MMCYGFCVRIGANRFRQLRIQICRCAVRVWILIRSPRDGNGMRAMQLRELMRMYDTLMKGNYCTIKSPFTAIVPRMLLGSTDVLF